MHGRVRKPDAGALRLRSSIAPGSAYTTDRTQAAPDFSLTFGGPLWRGVASRPFTRVQQLFARR